MLFRSLHVDCSEEKACLSALREKAPFISSVSPQWFFVDQQGNLQDNFFAQEALLMFSGYYKMDLVPAVVFKKLDLDVSAGFNLGAYHDFSSLSTLNLEQRQDQGWDIYSGLTYHWRPWFAIRTFYRFIKSVNRNNFFERDRHMAGGEVIFSV